MYVVGKNKNYTDILEIYERYFDLNNVKELKPRIHVSRIEYLNM